MNQPNAFDSTKFTREQSTALIDQTRSEPSAPPHGGAVHAVPVLDVVGSSSWPVEALYRIFEILITVIGLTLGLPLMLLLAVLIWWDSPARYSSSIPVRDAR